MKIEKNQKIYLNGELMKVVSTEFVNPGKMQSFTRVVLKGLLNGVVVKHTFKPKDRIVFADDIAEITAYFSYQEQNNLLFVQEDLKNQALTYLQVDSAVLPKEHLALLQHAQDERVLCVLLVKDNVVIKVELPLQLNLRVKSADMVSAHDKVVQGTKNAQLTSGHNIRVPAFIEANDLVTVAVADLKYVAIVRKEK